MKSLIDRDKKTIWHPFTQLLGGFPTEGIISGKGVYLYTESGRRLIDAISSWWVNLHGHSNEAIAAAVAKQALELEHVIFAGFTHEPAVKLAENLLRILPNNQDKVFFSGNGSTAVEVALKMAFQYWHNLGVEKRRVVAFEGAYHGDTFGAMSVGARSLFSRPFEPYLFEVETIPFPHFEEQANDSILDRFEVLVQKGDVASFIYEPLLQGSAGMRMFPPSVLEKLLNIAKENSVLCIADEVFTGFGRTGLLFASDYVFFQPDIICLSKGITGGTMPLGVTSCTNDIISAYLSEDLFKTFFHGHSYTANPIACAAANASFDILNSDTCQQAIKSISRQQSLFVEDLSTNTNAESPRSLGTVFAVNLKTDGIGGYTDRIREKIYSYFMNKGILIRPLGNVIYIVPPYVMTDQELDFIHCHIRRFLDENL